MPYASSDQQRPLSEQGLHEVDQVIAPIVNELIDLDAVWVSPYLRTQQTWNRIVSQYSLTNVAITRQAITHNLITPSGKVKDVLSQLEEARYKRILLVTHQPLIGSLLDTLCGFDCNRHFMGTANLAAIRLDDELPLSSGLGELLWLRRPA